MLFPSLKPMLAGDGFIDLIWLSLGSAPMVAFAAHAPRRHRAGPAAWLVNAARSRPPSPRRAMCR